MAPLILRNSIVSNLIPDAPTPKRFSLIPPLLSTTILRDPQARLDVSGISESGIPRGARHTWEGNYTGRVHRKIDLEEVRQHRLGCRWGFRGGLKSKAKSIKGVLGFRA